MPYIPNVSPNELIESAWGNKIRDHVVQRFASAAARDTAIPAPTVGMACYLENTAEFLVYTAKITPPAWRKPWNVAWGRITGLFPPDANGMTGAVSVPGATVTLGPPGRLVRVVFSADIFAVGAAHVAIRLQTGATVYRTSTYTMTANSLQAVYAEQDIIVSTVPPTSMEVVVDCGGTTVNMVRQFMHSDDVGPV